MLKKVYRVLQVLGVILSILLGGEMLYISYKCTDAPMAIVGSMVLVCGILCSLLDD